ncbi:MAG: DMT family transporter [Clostridia bacterium]|nr:DMT family transporter [Clostridia bacterium]
MKKTYLYAGIAIFCWSTVATTCKLLLNELNSFQLLWMNSLIAGVFLLILNLCTGSFKIHKDYNLKDYLCMACIGLPGTLFYYVFYYLGTDIMPASQAFIINYLWPIMSVLFACVILKEKLTFKKILAIIISFVGVAIVIGGALKGFDKKTLLGAVYCILGAVSYGIFTALNQKKSYNKTMTLMVSFLATFVITTVINAFEGALFVPRIEQVAGFLWNGIFTVAIANAFWIMALEKGKTAKVSNLAYITPFLSSLWTSIFLDEKITVNSMVGLAVIVLGIFIQLNNKEKNA